MRRWNLWLFEYYASCDVIILDYAHAFDKVPHIILLAKLRQLRLSDHLLQWIALITTFHVESQQTVVYKKAKSAETSVTSDVIQARPWIRPYL